MADDEVSIDPSGAKIDRVHLDIAFIVQATVAEVNALLSSIGAKIVSMLEGVNIILVRVPDPGDLDALDDLVSRLEADPIVRYVNKSYMPEPATLPPNYDFTSLSQNDLEKIDHHLAIRAHAAWNAKAALKDPFSDPPFLVVPDHFGDGGLNGDFDFNSNPTEFEGANPHPTGHGYHVLGIIAGKHGGGRTPRGLVTGTYPGRLGLRAIDFQGGINSAMAENRMLMAVRRSTKNVIINSSYSVYPRSCAGLLTDCVETLARSWIEKVRGTKLYATGKSGPASLENRFLHITAAGNIDGPNDSSDAVTASKYNAARLLSSLTTITGTNLENLNNRLVIENRANGSSQPYSADCLDTTSKFPGDLSAVGTDVHSFTDGHSRAGSLTGTSMATPQVAGLAAYVWSLAPGLSTQELVSLLKVTANPHYLCIGNATPAPLIDAYAAVLAIDKAGALSGASLDEAPVRLAILDVVGNDADTLGGNGVFDENDLARFLLELHLFDPPRIDYSRFDLNGDGYTGGRKRTARFNLDIDYPPTYGSVTQDIEGSEMGFDEKALTDMQILCYYAYSPLYTGNKDQRRILMDPYRNECGHSMMLAYTGDRSLGKYTQLYTLTIAADGTVEDRQEIVSLEVWGSSLTWSPDGQRLAFYARDREAGTSGIYIVDADGKNLIDFSKRVGLDTTERPVWSPDGKRLAFSSYGGLYVANIDGSGLVNLSEYLPDICPYPNALSSNGLSAWAPGNKIVFLMGCQGEQRVGYVRIPGVQIFAINADGTGLEQLGSFHNGFELTKGESYSVTAGYPMGWSPDGKHLLYLERTVSMGPPDVTVDPNDPTAQNTVIYRESSDVRNKTTNACILGGACVTNYGSGGCAAASWSPDGSKVACMAYTDSSIHVRIVDIDTRAETVIENHTDTNTGMVYRVGGRGPGISWSPDGRWLAFEGTITDGRTATGDLWYGSNILIARTDGSKVIDVTAAAGNNRNETDPVWAPAPTK